MNGSIVNLNTSVHQTVQELLPWFALGTLDAEEEATVLEHVRICTHCQADLAFHKKMTTFPVPASPAEQVLDVEQALAKLRPRLQPQTPHALTGRSNRPKQAIRHAIQVLQRYWLQLALGTQFAVIAGLCFVLFQPEFHSEHNADYHGLGSGTNIDGNIVVMFKPQTTEQELRHILQASGVRIVDGPTVTDAYILHAATNRQNDVLKQLRTKPAVNMAESLESGSQP